MQPNIHTYVSLLLTSSIASLSILRLWSSTAVIKVVIKESRLVSPENHEKGMTRILNSTMIIIGHDGSVCTLNDIPNFSVAFDFVGDENSW